MGQARRRVPGDATKKCSLRNSPKKVVTVIVATVDGDDGRREQQEDEEQKRCCGAAHGCCHRCCCYSSSKWIDNNSQTQFLAHISLSVPLSNLPQISRSLSLPLKCPSNLSSSSVLGFVAGGKRSKILWGNFQDFEVLFFGCWEVIDMNAFCDSQMGLSRSGDDDDGGSAKICVLEVFFSGT